MQKTCILHGKSPDASANEKERGSETAGATCAGDEAQGVIAWLHVLPEVDVAVVEDVLMQVQVVKALQPIQAWLSLATFILTHTCNMVQTI